MSLVRGMRTEGAMGSMPPIGARGVGCLTPQCPYLHLRDPGGVGDAGDAAARKRTHGVRRIGKIRSSSVTGVPMVETKTVLDFDILFLQCRGNRSVFISI